MKRFIVTIATIAVLSLTTTFVSIAIPADDQAVVSQTAAPVLDVVTLKDGSVIYGEVVEMTGGVLQITNALASDVIKVKWAEVSKLVISHPLPFHFKEGSVLVGTVEADEPGMLRLKVGPIGGVLTMPMDTVIKVNPIVQRPVIYVGSLNAAYTDVTGNSQLTTASVLGNLEAKSEQLRLTLLGRYVYGDNAGSLATRNGRGTIKLDFFITKRFFWFASAYFENDYFQDLKLRTAIASGPGYQWIDRDDFNGIFKNLTFYTEAGPAYFNEDFRTAPDDASFRARVATKFNWSLFDDRITLYHDSEIFPSLQDLSEFYFTMNNGVRLKIWGGLTSGFQLTTRYNNQPPAGSEKTDNLYLYTLGYAFDTTRKR